MSKDQVLLNEDIVLKETRCIGDEGKVYGIISSDEALKIATGLNLDLVLIAPDGKPPVCKIMDYGKYLYQEEKKLKEAKKKQKQIEIKELKLTAKTAQNDLNFKIKHAREFIEDGKHVKFRVFLKGREISEPQPGITMLNRVLDSMNDIAVAEKDIFVEGRYVNVLLLPKKDIKSKKGE